MRAIYHAVERKRLAEQLRESEERLRLALQAAGMGWWHWDVLRNVLTVSDQVRHIFGVPATAEPTFELCLTLLLSEDRPAVERQLADSLASPGDREIEFRIRRADGSIRWISAKGRALHAGGNARSIMGVVSDITERKQAEESLRRSEERFRVAQELSLDAFNILTAVRDDAGRIVDFRWDYANPEAGRLLRNAPAELVGRRLLEVLPGNKANSDLFDHYVRVVETGQPHDYELYYESDGIQGWFRNMTVKLGDGVAVYFTDITSRKQAEQGLRQAKAAAEAANAAKSHFLANMSHEIRTPMTAVLGFAELLAGMDCSEEEQREYLQTIQQSGKNLLYLIDDILDLSKIEAGRASVERVECAPRQIVEEVVALMQVRADEKKLALDVDYQFPLPLVIWTDPGGLRQILVNLVGNAIKFTDIGGVRLDVSYTGQERAMMQFVVSDTGIGIGKDHLEEIFKPFSQADPSTTRRFGGTGLGLTISRRLAEAMEGRITVESELGKGSTFTLTIDAGSVAASTLVQSFGRDVEAGADAAPESPRLTGSVLLVEDTPANQQLFETALTRAGLDVDVTDNGEEACRMAFGSATAGEPYDVILMDMQMPGLDGYEATRRLRGEGWRGPIIAITAHAMTGDREKCVAAGCDDYLAKPVSIDSLLETVRRHLKAEAR